MFLKSYRIYKMDNKTTINRHMAILILRVLLGLIFLMQGYGKIFNFGIEQLYHNFFVQFESTFLPKWLIWFTVYYTSYVELICGLLLTFGMFKQISLCLLASVLVIISFGHGLLEPVWDLQHLFFRASMLIVLMLLPEDWDKFKMDAFIMFKKEQIEK